MIDFNDLIPRAPKRGLIDFNDLIPTSQTGTSTQEKQIPSIEPTSEDLEIYRRMGLKQYVSPSGKIYPLTSGKKTLTEWPLLDIGAPVRIPDRMIGAGGMAKPVILEAEAPTEYLRTREVPEVLSEIEKRKPIGFAESIKREGAWGVTRRLPFVGASFGAMRNIEIGKAAKRLQTESYKQMYAQPRERWTMQMIANPHPSHLRRIDTKLVTDYFNKLDEESRRDRTFWAKVGSGALDLAPWMIEFGVTGGLSKLGSTATRKFGQKLIGQYAKSKAGQLALRSAGWLGGGAARTTVGLPHRVAEQYTKRRLPERLTISEQGQVSFQWPKEKPYTTFAKAWGNVFVEAASEEAGATITKGLVKGIGKMPFGNKFLTALRKAWTKLSPDNTMMKFWQKIFRRGGYSNLIGEIGEERLATIMHSIAKTEDFGVGKDANVIDRLVAGFTQDIKNFPVEATVLSIPGATRFALGKATGTIAEPERPTEAIAKPEAVEVAPEAIKEELVDVRDFQKYPIDLSDSEAKALSDAADKAFKNKDLSAFPTLRKRAMELFNKTGKNYGLYITINSLEGELATKAQPPTVAKAEQVKPGQAKSIETIRKEGQQEPDVLIVKPSAKPRRVVVSAKGKSRTVVSIDDKTEVYKFTDFGGGIGVKGKSLINIHAQRPLMDLPSAAAARKAATTLKEVGIDFKQPQEEIQRQFNEWLKENNVANTKEDIIDFLTGRGKELETEDYIRQFDIAALKGIDYDLEKAVNTIQYRLKDFVQEVPEFALNPTFTFDKESGQLVFKDRYRFSIYPNYFGLNAESLKDGQTIRFDIDSFNIKQPSAKKLKTAEPFLGEPKILGRTTKKPIPVEKLGKKGKPYTQRKMTKAEEAYEKALSDIEGGIRVEVPGGVTERAVTEEDISRVAELGKKAGRQGWTVEHDILGRQERGTAETKVDIGDAIKIIRNVFSAKPKVAAQPPTVAKAEVGVERLTFDELSDRAKGAIAGDARTKNQPASAFTDSIWEIQTVNIELLRKQNAGVWSDKFVRRGAMTKGPLIVSTSGEVLDGNNRLREAIDRGDEKIEILKRVEQAQPVAKPEPKETTEEPSLFVPSKPTVKPKLSFDDLIPGPPDVKHIQNVVVDTFRDWPKGIKKVGKDYWVEIMAAAKQLATPYRYKALRQTMLGVFRHKKKPVSEVVGIEVQDVTDALTATHELAHNIDWLLSNKIFPSSIKARFPDTTVGEMTLRNELKEISKVLRPDMWERPKAYIKSHVELMADFISHYILDPEKTKELAPNLTRAFEAKLAAKPELFDTISKLQESRYTGPEEPPIAKHIREVFPLPKEFTPLKLAIDMTDEGYVKAAEELGITAARHYKLLIQRAQREAHRIDELVPNKARQIDLVVIAENGSKNPWTGKTREEILADGLTANERKAINLFRAYQEKARQTVNKYLRGADIAEYIKFIEDYFIHAYQTPLTEKYKTAIARWAKRSPQAKKRVLPDLAKAVEIGLKPRAKTLSEGLMLWAGINYRVMTNKAFLRILPQITNDDGVSILQKPQDYPNWPTVDYWPIRQNYAIPLPNRGVLLFQGRVAVDPRVKPFIDAMFGRKVFNTPVRVIEALNATWKAFELTLFSFFHHQAEFFSACGSLGPRALPFVGGYYGKRAQVFGKKKLFGFLPTHIGVLKAGKELEKTSEFMDDYLAHGGQRGYISTEGINLMERSLKRAADYLENIIQYRPTTPLTGVYAAAFVHVKTAQGIYSFHQKLLWDNVNRAKLVAYYNIVADGAKSSDLPIKDVKQIAAKYIADNFGGQEWLNTMFRNRKTRQFWTQLMMSLDWTWSQIKTARWPLGIGGGNAARRAFMRKIGIHHWFWYLSAIAGFTIAGSYAMSGKGPWENEKGHKLDIDWTKVWRSLPWNKDWKARGDYNRRYIGLGKAGRELVRWVTSPLRAFGYKLSPVARSTFEQTTGYNVGSNWAEPWAREDLQLYQEVYARFKHLMENFKPFAFSGNNAFLAFPSRKGMTQWKATRAYEDIYKARAVIAMGGIGGKIAKANQILKKDEKKLRAEIAEACKLNNVDASQADRAALTGVRSKYYSLFWKATKMPEKKSVKLCNDYANALLELGIVPRGFKQSLRYRAYELPERAKEIGVQVFHEVAQRKTKDEKD